MDHLWIIWVDPHWLQHVSPDGKDKNPVQDQFLSLVLQHPRAIVLASFHNEPQYNTKQQQEHYNLQTWYGYELLQDLFHHVVAGDTAGLAAYQAASVSHILVETDLDADDALAYRFVETAQRQAAQSVGHHIGGLGSTAMMTHSETYCPEYHAKWWFYPEEEEEDSNTHNNNKQQLLFCCVFCGIRYFDD
ncbi:hypothetical protein ACA910_007042 [Epithemia clementina (nom. ined.)]